MAFMIFVNKVGANSIKLETTEDIELKAGQPVLIEANVKGASLLNFAVGNVLTLMIEISGWPF